MDEEQRDEALGRWYCCFVFCFLGRFNGDNCGIHHDHRSKVRHMRKHRGRRALGQRGGQLEQQRRAKRMGKQRRARHMGRQRRGAQLERLSVRPEIGK